jgi:hypothetical protein
VRSSCCGGFESFERVSLASISRIMHAISYGANCLVREFAGG